MVFPFSEAPKLKNLEKTGFHKKRALCLVFSLSVFTLYSIYYVPDFPLRFSRSGFPVPVNPIRFFRKGSTKTPNPLRSMALLVLPVEFNFQVKNSSPSVVAPLGDGYRMSSLARSHLAQTSIAVVANITNSVKLSEVLDLFESLAGKTTFEWRPTADYPLRSWFVEQWSVTWEGVQPSGDGLWILTATFESR